MDSSGLKEIIVQAKLLLPGTCEKVFQGNGYYQDINAYCILYEVLLALYWESLEEYPKYKKTYPVWTSWLVPLSYSGLHWQTVLTR